MANYQSFPALENAGMYESPHFDRLEFEFLAYALSLTAKSYSELMAPHAQESTGTTYVNSYTSEHVFAGLDPLPGLLGLSQPQYFTSKDPLSSTTSSFPNLTRGNVFLQDPSNVELCPPPIPYLGDLGFETSNHIGSFSGGTISTFFPQDGFTQDPRFGEFLGGLITENNTPRPVYSPEVTGQQGVPTAHHMPACPTYVKPNTLCSGSHDCGEVFGASNAPEQILAKAVVTRSGLPFGETYPYLVS